MANFFKQIFSKKTNLILFGSVIFSLGFLIFQSANVLAATSAPTAPTSTSNITVSSTRYNWTAPAGNSGEFWVLDRSTNGVDFTFVATSSPTSTVNYTFTGLATNTAYWFRVANGDFTAATSSYVTSSRVYTLATNYGLEFTGPEGSISTSTYLFTLVTSTSGNPSSTEYSVYESVSSNYVFADGTLDNPEQFASSAVWTSRTVTGLSPNTHYIFLIRARNGDGVTTTQVTGNNLYTLANPAGTPTIGTSTITSLPITIAVNGNSTSTEYAIYNTSTGNYLDLDGDANGSSPDWRTTSTWGTSFAATGLTANTGYQFVVISRNGSNINAATSTASVIAYTLANAPTASAATGAANGMAFSWTGNATEYYAEDTTAGTNSGWTTATSFNVGGINCGTSHTFRVKGRNAASTETAWSSSMSGTTGACGTGIPVSTAPSPTTPAMPTTPVTPIVPPIVPVAPASPVSGASVSFPSAASPVAVFVHTLWVGSRGNEVKALQQKLRELGYFKYPTNTGYFGPITRASVVAFQKAQKLRPYPGWVGPLTRAALNSL